MTSDALVWGLIALAAGLIAFAVVVHEVSVWLRHRAGVRWIEDRAGHDERRTVSQLFPSQGRSVVAAPQKAPVATTRKVGSR